MIRLIVFILATITAMPPVAAQVLPPGDSLVAAVHRQDEAAVALHLQDPEVIANELNPECPPGTRCKPITYAAEGKSTKILRMLLEAGADPNGTNSVGDNGLIMALMVNNLAAIDLLLVHGGDVNQANRFGITPFTGVVMIGNSSVVRKFALCGGDPNMGVLFDKQHGKRLQSGTLFHLAIEGGHLGVVRALLDNGADWRRPDTLGRLPIDYAQQLGHTEIVELLEQVSRPQV